MSVANFVLTCALTLMGRSAEQLPPIIVVERPADATPYAVAFVRSGERAIYLVESSSAFRAAKDANRTLRGCRELELLRLIASAIVHEEWHLLHGPDERGAYYAQLTELQRIGSEPGRWAYDSVKRAMRATLADVERRAERARAAQLAAASAPAPPAAGGGMVAADRPWLTVALESSRLPVMR